MAFSRKKKWLLYDFFLNEDFYFVSSLGVRQEAVPHQAHVPPPRSEAPRVRRVRETVRAEV